MEPPRFFSGGFLFGALRREQIPAFQLRRLPFDELSRLDGGMENLDKSPQMY